MTELRPSEIYRGRKILLIGGTGFLGKVTVSLLLDRFPQVGKVYMLVRAGSQREAEARFWTRVVVTPPFDPLRARYGAEFEKFIRERVEVLVGDVAQPDLGFPADVADSVSRELDVIISGAGKVTFNPPVDTALRANVIGTQNVLQFARRMRRPALIHVSTCFVAGNRSGSVWENDPILGYYPRRNGFPGLSIEEELAECESLSAKVLREAMELAEAAARKAWIRSRLTRLALERARFHGWPNIYTYTKSLGEQLVAAEAGIARSIIRPSIVESALAFPFPGWNEGFTTTAPLILLALRRQVQIPATAQLILDVSPVDAVAAVILAAAAEVCVRQPRLVYQASTGDLNPLTMRRAIELIGMYKRQQLMETGGSSRFVSEIVARMEEQLVSVDRFHRTSAPMLNKLARAAAALLGQIRVPERMRARVDRFERITRQTTTVCEMFRPFTVENRYLFRSDNVRALYGTLPAEERQLIPWRPESIDWYDYFLNVHLPGLEKWVFPRLEQDPFGQFRRAEVEMELPEWRRSDFESSWVPLPEVPPRSGQAESDRTVALPEVVRRAGSQALEVMQHGLYELVMRTSYEGRDNIPVHTNFLIAANHCSHLDMGLVRMALGGGVGRELVVFAAADYFFNTPLKRLVAENFTNLVPLERIGPARRSLLNASWYLQSGHSGLLFPEGTRSRTGQMGEFKPVVGYLSLSSRVGILPVYLHGTFEAFPKGARMFRRRTIGARIGSFISFEQIREMVEGLPHAVALRLIAGLVRHQIANLRDGTDRPFEARHFTERWQ